MLGQPYFGAIKTRAEMFEGRVNYGRRLLPGPPQNDWF